MKGTGTGAELASLRNQLLRPGSKSSAAFLIRPLHRLESFFFFPPEEEEIQHGIQQPSVNISATFLMVSRLTGAGGAGSGMAEGLQRLICGVHRLELISSLTSSVSEATAHQPGGEAHQSAVAARRVFVLEGRSSIGGGEDGSSHSQEPKTSRLADRCCSRGKV